MDSMQHLEQIRSLSAQIGRMKGSVVGDILDRLEPADWRSMLIFISGYSAKGFANALKYYICGVQADDDNQCILPKGHAGSHDPGEFAPDVQLDQPKSITSA